MKKKQTPLEAAAELLEQYGWYALKVQPITEATELDWIESRERAYRLADYNDARAARMAAVATTSGGAGSSTRIASAPFSTGFAEFCKPAGSSTRIASAAKAKRAKKVVPGTGTLSITF